MFPVNVLNGNSDRTAYRMTVTDRGGHDSSEHIQVPLVLMVVDELHGAVSNDQRLAVERLEHRIQIGPVDLVDLIAGEFRLSKRKGRLAWSAGRNAASDAQRLTLNRWSLSDLEPRKRCLVGQMLRRQVGLIMV